MTNAMTELLWEARRTGVPLDPAAGPWPELTQAQAAEVAEEQYARDGVSRSWKLGALDAAAQRFLGIDAPVCVPLLGDAAETDVTEVHLSRAGLVTPRFEVEIGVLLDGVDVYPVPCVEIADCRFAGWRLPPYGMTADLALQGRMLFGPPGVVTGDVEVTVDHDGRRAVTGTASWQEAVARLDLLDDHTAADRVATGAITALVDCAPGRWDFDFGTLGHLAVTVD